MKSTAQYLLLHPFVQGRLAISSPISSKLGVFYRILLLPEVTFVFHRWANAFCQQQTVLNDAHLYFRRKCHLRNGINEEVMGALSLEAHGGQQFETAGGLKLSD